jgi:hypothetical protein
MSLFHLAAFVIGCGVLLVVTPNRREAGVLKRRMARLALFIALFLIVGSLLNGLWSCLIYGNFYGSADYVFGFVPFWPPTDSFIETRDAGGNFTGVSFAVQIAWLIFSAATWAVAVLIYRLILRKRLALRELATGHS